MFLATNLAMWASVAWFAVESLANGSRPAHVFLVAWAGAWLLGGMVSLCSPTAHRRLSLVPHAALCETADFALGILLALVLAWFDHVPTAITVAAATYFHVGAWNAARILKAAS